MVLSGMTVPHLIMCHLAGRHLSIVHAVMRHRIHFRVSLVLVTRMFVRLLIHGIAHMWRGVVRKALELFAFGHGLDHLTYVKMDILYAPMPFEHCRRYRK